MFKKSQCNLSHIREICGKTLICVLFFLSNFFLYNFFYFGKYFNAFFYFIK